MSTSEHPLDDVLERLGRHWHAHLDQLLEGATITKEKANSGFNDVRTTFSVKFPYRAGTFEVCATHPDNLNARGSYIAKGKILTPGHVEEWSMPGYEIFIRLQNRHYQQQAQNTAAETASSPKPASPESP